MILRTWVFGLALCFCAPVGADDAWSMVHSGGLGRNILALAGSPDRFVAITENQALSYSDDGVTWTQARNLPPVGLLSEVAYGNGVFVAPSEGMTLISTDGITWTRHLMPGLRFDALIFTGTQFIGSQSQRGIFHSPDGVSWTRASSVPAGTAASRFVTHAGTTLFTTVTNGLSTLYKNTGGLTWTAHTIPFLGGGLYWNGTNWSARTNSSHLVSNDAVNWTTEFGVLPPDNIIGSLDTEVGPIVVALNGAFRGGGTGVILDSFGVPYGQYIRSFARSGNRILIGGNSGALHAYDIGSGWTVLQDVNSQANGYVPAAITEHEGRTLAWSGDGRWVISTADGVDWSEATTNLNSILPSNAYLDARMVSQGGYLYGSSGKRILRSTDGETWSEVTQLPFAVIDFATDGSKIFAVTGGTVHEDSRLVTTNDGVTWELQANWAGAGLRPIRILHDGTRWLVYFSNSTRLVSTDGLTWSSEATSLPSGVTFFQITGGRYSAFYTTRAAVSADGISWATTPSDFAVAGPPVWDGTRWLMIGQTLNDWIYAIYDSVDGIDWRYNQGTNGINPRRLVDTSFGVFAYGEAGQVLQLTNRQPQAPAVPSALLPLQRFPATVIGDNHGSLATITGLPAGTQYQLTSDYYSTARIILDETTGAFNVQRTVATYEAGAFEYVAVGEGGRSNTGRIDFLAAVPSPSSYANLSALVVAPPKPVKLNKNAKFTFSVKHSGGMAVADNVAVRITVQAGAQLVSASLKKATCQVFTGYALCALKEPMAPGESFSGKVKARSSIPGALSVTVQVSTTTTEIYTADNTNSAAAMVGG